MDDRKHVLSVLDGQARFDWAQPISWTLPRELISVFAFGTAYYFAYRYGMLFSQASASPFWFPDSILLCALLWSQPGKWWIFVLASLPIRLLPDIVQNTPLWFLLVTYALDSLKGLAAAWALRRFISDPLNLRSFWDFGVFCLVAVLVIPACSAFGGAAARTILECDYWPAWVEWFLGDSLAQLVITPPILVLISRVPGALRALSHKRRMEAAITLGGLVVAAYVAGHMGGMSVMLTEPRFYAPMVFLFWSALRFGMFGASVSIGLWALLFATAAASGQGPFTGASPSETALALQAFLFPRSITVYIVGLSIERFMHAQSLLRESEERFRNLANAVPALIWTAGRDMLCDFANQGWVKFTGQPIEAHLNGGWLNSVHPQDRQNCLQIYSAAFGAREPFANEYRLRRYDGEYRCVADHGVPRYTTDGEFNGYVGVAIDISGRKRAEENERQFAHLQRVAALGQFAGAIAHDVRQPLQAIMLNAETAQMLLKQPKPPINTLRQILFDICEADKRANEVIGRVRDLMVKREPRMETLDINSVVTSAVKLIVGDAQRRGVQVGAELADELPAIRGDLIQLEQVIINLAINGMDAMGNTPESSRRLVIRTRACGIDAVETIVIDHGNGIPPNALSQVFSAFFTTKMEGTGLGLAISKSIIAAHHGRIWAENSVEGAAFHFTLPIAQQQ